MIVIFLPYFQCSVYVFICLLEVIKATQFEIALNPSELQLNKANTSDTKAAYLDFNLSISNFIVPTKIYDKCGDIDFEIVNFPFLDGDVPRSTSY